MSEENRELVKRVLAAFETDGDAFLAHLDPEVEWTPFEEGVPSHGHRAAMQLREQWLETWERHRIDVEEVLGEGDDVVAAVHVTGVGSQSGVEVDVRLYVHFRIRAGKIAYMYEHEDRSEALRAAGLSE